MAPHSGSLFSPSWTEAFILPINIFCSKKRKKSKKKRKEKEQPYLPAFVLHVFFPKQESGSPVLPSAGSHCYCCFTFFHAASPHCPLCVLYSGSSCVTDISARNPSQSHVNGGRGSQSGTLPASHPGVVSGGRASLSFGLLIIYGHNLTM